MNLQSKSTKIGLLGHVGKIVVALVVLFLLMCITMVQRSPEINRSESIQNKVASTTVQVPYKTYTHTCDKVNVDRGNLKSQSHEDEQLLVWFKGLCNGTYLEIGGLNGVTFSNTYVFNKELEWRGVLIELSTSNYQQLVVNRPNELATIHAGVCGQKRLLHYVEGKGAVSGIWEFAPQTFRNQWWKGLTLESPEVHPVDCAPLADLLEPHLGQSFYFDFFSLDVEGAEFEVLKAIDFTKLGFGVIFAEADEHNQRKNMALRMLLESKGYKFIMEYERSYWFVNNAFSEIYSDRLY